MKRTLSLLSLVLVILIVLSGCVVQVPSAASPQPSATVAPPPSGSIDPTEAPSPDTAIVESPVLHYSQASAEQVAAVEALVSARQQAIQNADVAALLATVSPADPWYMQEQKNLARSLADFPVSSYDLGVRDVMAAENGELKATIVQSYLYKGKKRSCTFTERFVPKDSAFLDAGIAWLSLENAAVRVTYWDDSYRDIAMQSVSVVSSHLKDLESRFGFTPRQKISIRIFDDAEVFTESIKLHLDTYWGGWTEYGESLKLMLGKNFEDSYREVLCHESSHYFLSSMTNDNACYWMQEGFATMVEQGVQGLDDLRVGRYDALRYAAEEGKLPGFDWLCNSNPELLLDDGSISIYYAASSFALAWFIDKYGFEDLKKAYDLLRDDPYIEGSAAEKIPELNEYTLAAMEQVTGDTRADFKAGFDKALKEYVASLKK